jgi:hypothetical protein
MSALMAAMVAPDETPTRWRLEKGGKMTDVVDDKLAREIVSDLRSGVGEPGGFLGPETVAKEKGSGWQAPSPLESPPGVAICDQMMDVQDALDKRDLEKRLRGG